MRVLRFSALCLAICVASNALAHPHVRVAYQVEPLVQSNGIRALQVNWQLDAMTSAQIRDNIDLNKNGVLDPEELQAFAEGNFELMKPHQFFLTVEQGHLAQPIPFEVHSYRAVDAGHGFQGGVHISFVADLPASSNHTNIKVRFFDPTWYMAIQPRPGFGLAAHHDCSTELLSETRDTSMQGQQVVQFLFVQCAKGAEVQPTAQFFPATEPTNGDAL